MLLAVSLVGNAWAQPEDLSLSSLQTWQGQRVLTGQHETYLQLLRELGTVVANHPLQPAETLGANGFDLSAANTFEFVIPEKDGSTSPWARANADGQVNSW